MALDRLGPLDVRWKLGPAGGTGPAPVVVLLHGYGAPGDDLLGLEQGLDVPAGTRFVYPVAPLKLDTEAMGFPAGMGESRAWWEMDLYELQQRLAQGDTTPLTGPAPQQLLDACAAVEAMLHELSARADVDSERIVLGGFSQGAIVSLHTALNDPELLAGVVLLSAAPVDQARIRAHAHGLVDLAVLQSHGTEDPLLPFALAQSLRGELVEAGVAHTWVPFDGGHGIGRPVTAALAEFLRDLLEA